MALGINQLTIQFFRGQESEKKTEESENDKAGKHLVNPICLRTCVLSCDPVRGIGNTVCDRGQVLFSAVGRGVSLNSFWCYFTRRNLISLLLLWYSGD